MSYELGTYGAEVEDAQLTTAKTGTDQVYVDFRFTEGPNQGKRINDYFALTDAALKYTMGKLRACGLADDDLGNLASIRGAKVELVLKEEQDKRDGTMRTRIAFVNKPGEGRAAAPPEEQSAIANKWKAKIAALPKEESDPFA